MLLDLPAPSTLEVTEFARHSVEAATQRDLELLVTLMLPSHEFAAWQADIEPHLVADPLAVSVTLGGNGDAATRQLGHKLLEIGHALANLALQRGQRLQVTEFDLNRQFHTRGSNHQYWLFLVPPQFGH